MRTLLLLLSLALLGSSTAQVNGYAQITGISGAVLSIGVSNESYAPFLVGKEVVIMQMQDNVIGSNTANNSNFGNLGSIAQAGRYEVRTIVSVARNAFGKPTGLVLNGPPSISFSIGTNTRVQAITFELFGAGGNYTTTANMFPLAWNGDIGGVLAFQVNGTLTLAHIVHADEMGFHGGAADQATSGTCDATTFRSIKSAAFAYKGQGIYRATNTAYQSARGKIINGGGGGNEHNGGGGGGSNYSGGGAASAGYGCGTTSSGGLGGIALATHIGIDRVFMGGGGGGGEGNNNVATSGAKGGGIVLIKAERIRTTGSCSGRRISSDGGAAANSGNDGAGGGGAGGSIVLEVPEFELSNSCALTIRSNGGNGGRVNDAALHGAGGGGGQGVVIFSSNIPVANVTVQTINGVGGCSSSANPCTVQAGSGLGADNRGILSGGGSPLPVELLGFQAIQAGAEVHVDWSTASEYTSDHFVVQRSIDADQWENVGRVEAAGNSVTVRTYRLIDPEPLPALSYYRLEQVDQDGSLEYSDIVPVLRSEGQLVLKLFPNPADTEVRAFTEAFEGVGSITVIDAAGRKVLEQGTHSGNTQLLELSALPSGSYTVVLLAGDRVAHQRLVVQH